MGIKDHIFIYLIFKLYLTTEEQRRKARINLWISKLGAILFRSDSGKQVSIV